MSRLYSDILTGEQKKTLESFLFTESFLLPKVFWKGGKPIEIRLEVHTPNSSVLRTPNLNYKIHHLKAPKFSSFESTNPVKILSNIVIFHVIFS